MSAPASSPHFPIARFFRLGLLLLLLALAIASYVTGRDRTVLESDLFPFDPTKPYRLRLARGGFLNGMNTIVISANGYTRLHRIVRNGERDHASLHLSLHQLSAIASAINLHGLPQLYSEYIDDRVVDGKLWVLTIFQAGRRKDVYFSNRFTYSIWYFAIDLDDIIAWSDPDVLVWKRCLQLDASSIRPWPCGIEGESQPSL